MPTTPGSKKAQRSQARKRIHNLRVKRVMDRSIKNLSKLADAGEYAQAQEELANVYKAIDKAAKRGVIHENKAARKKSQVAQMARQPE